MCGCWLRWLLPGVEEVYVRMNLWRCLIIVLSISLSNLSVAGDLQELRRYYSSCMNFAAPLLSEWVEKDPDLIVKIIGHQVVDPGFVPKTSKQEIFVKLASFADTEVTASDRAKLKKLNFRCDFDPKRLRSGGLRSLVYTGLANAEMLHNKLNDNSLPLTYREASDPDMGNIESILAKLSPADQQILMDWSQTIMAENQHMFVSIQLLLNNYEMDL
jgi:hypothetical protein